MSQEHGFFHELKRRHVVRVAIVYAVTAWVLLQLASIVFPTFGAPDWALKVFIAVLVLGFPIALILAWAFELTPEGVRRTEPAHSPEARSEEQTQRVGRQLNTIIAGVLAVIVALLLLDRFFVGRESALAPKPAPVAPDVPPKSIAVLPFESLSEDKANAYFATGMQDEILTRLAGIRDLRVISRTSTAQYASRPADLRTVGQQLGVATVLEGSVQKAGDAVHINVQLIDAASDRHLWARSYNRELKDIFAVEGEVAQSIADALNARLSPQEAAQVGAVPTSNPAAYDSYLRGLASVNRARDQDVLTATEMPRAIAQFEQAVALDPQFALAEAMLAQAHLAMYFYGADHSEARLASAKATVDRALALQPDLGEARLALARYHYWGHRDYEPAVRELVLAQQVLPNNADVQLVAAAIARRQGRWNDAIAGFQKTAVLDPRSSIGLDQLGLTYRMLRRYAEADRAFAQSVAVAVDAADERATQGINTVFWKGDLQPLRAAFDSMSPNTDTYAGNLSGMYWLAWLSRDYAAATRLAASGSTEAWPDLSNITLPRTLYLAWARAAAADSAGAQEVYASVAQETRVALARQPDSAELHVVLGFAAAGLGLKDEALREGRRAAELLPPSRDAVSGPDVLMRLAQIEVRAGDKDAALEQLRQLIALPSGGAISAALLRLDPVWDPLRDDPRFATLLIQAEMPVVTEAKP